MLDESNLSLRVYVVARGRTVLWWRQLEWARPWMEGRRASTEAVESASAATNALTKDMVICAEETVVRGSE